MSETITVEEVRAFLADKAGVTVHVVSEKTRPSLLVTMGGFGPAVVADLAIGNLVWWLENAERSYDLAALDAQSMTVTMRNSAGAVLNGNVCRPAIGGFAFHTSFGVRSLVTGGEPQG